MLPFGSVSEVRACYPGILSSGPRYRSYFRILWSFSLLGKSGAGRPSTSSTGWPIIHGRVFLAPCKTWLVQCILLLQLRTLKSLFTRYQNNMAMLIWSDSNWGMFLFWRKQQRHCYLQWIRFSEVEEYLIAWRHVLETRKECLCGKSGEKKKKLLLKFLNFIWWNSERSCITLKLLYKCGFWLKCYIKSEKQKICRTNFRKFFKFLWIKSLPGLTLSIGAFRCLLLWCLK